MKRAFAFTFIAAGVSEANAQVLVIPPVETRMAFDEAESLLFVPGRIAGPLPDSGREDAAEHVLIPERPSSFVGSGNGEWVPFRGFEVSSSDDSIVATELEDAVSQPFRWSVNVPQRDWEFIVIHHSATEGGSVESIHREHSLRRDGRGRPWLGIGYHFVVGNGSGMDDGEIESTFRWRDQLHGAHSGSIRFNDSGIGICVIGNFEKHSPSSAQRDAVVELVGQLAREYRIPAEKIIGHRQIRATVCPGRHFPLEQIVNESVGQNSPHSLRN